MLKWHFWSNRKQELIRLRTKIVGLEGRLEKQSQFISGLARQFPEVAQELAKYRLGQGYKEIERVTKDSPGLQSVMIVDIEVL